MWLLRNITFLLKCYLLYYENRNKKDHENRNKKYDYFLSKVRKLPERFYTCLKIVVHDKRDVSSLWKLLSVKRLQSKTHY